MKLSKENRSKVMKSYENGFLDNVHYDGFKVSFAEVDENGINGNIEGVYEFALTGLSLNDRLTKLGWYDGSFSVEDPENEIELYHQADNDSACVSFDCFRTIYFNETNQEEAYRMGTLLATSLSNLISQIIKMNN